MFWESSCHSIQSFQIQKRVITIITGCGNKHSCRILLKKLTILPRMSQYILPLFAFVVNNGNKFLINSNIHNVDTRHSSNLHLTSANLGICQKGVYLSGIKIFNSLPFNIEKFTNNLRTFKGALKYFLT
jgi:hypothetical protein